MKASGKEIIQAIVEDMYEGREELRYSVLPPGIYRIYLHESDYKRLAPIVKHIVEESVRALNEEIDRMNDQLNASGAGLLVDVRISLLKLRRKARSLIQGEFSNRDWKKPAEGWQISINVDPNDELEPGDLCVNSELRLPQRIELGEGNPTRNITTIRRLGSSSRSERKFSEEPILGAEGSASVQTSDEPKTGHARIRYFENAQEKTFEMDKSLVVVGRGGPRSIVDLALEEGTKISREHFVLRRDDRSGKFYIRDMSKFGTRVNGIALTRSPATGETETTGTGLEMELPERATIELAGSLKIEFEVVGDAQPNGKL
jgi:hypothetical protein